MASHTESKDLKAKILNTEHWLRLVFMLLMYFILIVITRFIVSIALLVQWGFILITGAPHAKLKNFMKTSNRYLYQIMEYVSFNSDTKPFPFSDLPE